MAIMTNLDRHAIRPSELVSVDAGVCRYKVTGGMRDPCVLCPRTVFVDESAIDRACAESWNKLTAERLKTITATAWLTHED